MRWAFVAGCGLVGIGALVLLGAPLVPGEDILQPASVDGAPPVEPSGPSSSVVALGVGAALGLVGLGLIAFALRGAPSDLEDV